MKKGNRIGLYIFLVLLNAFVDLWVQYGLGAKDLGKHVINATIYSVIATSVIFYVIRMVAPKTDENNGN